MTRKMKDSGVEWIGEIPEGWNLSKIGSVYKERSTKVSDKDFKPLSVTKNGVVNQLENAAKTDNGDNRKLVKKNDFVINSRSDRRGSCGISSCDGSVSLINIVLEPRNQMSNLYYNYVFKSEEFADEFYRWGNGIVNDLWSTKWSSMKRIYIPYPYYEQQEKIANYLDKKCNKIDQTIEKEKQVIEKLKEYKQSVITEAVTKGLNPDVKMKDSGVEWIGEIPEDWKMVRIKNILIFNPPYSENLNDADNVSFIPMECLKNNRIEPKVSELSKVKGGYTYFANGDIIMAKVTPCFENGNIAVAEDLTNNVGFGSSELYVFRCTKSYTRYIFYYLQNNIFKQRCISTMYGTGGLKRVSSNFVFNYKLAIPPLNEQQEIADHLDKKCSAIDKLISNKEKVIEKLTEYKKSLIYECVTGKRDV